MNMMAPALPGSIVRRAVVALLALPLFAAPALATTIERVVSPGGIEAWLVHEPAVPMIAIDFAFVGGAAQDAPGKGGTASLVASLLDEGAGDLDAKTFHARLERKAIELGFQAERDTLRGTLRTLTENKDEAFEYLRLAVTQPRFDQSDVEVIRAQMLSMLRRATTSPTDHHRTRRLARIVPPSRGSARARRRVVRGTEPVASLGARPVSRRTQTDLQRAGDVGDPLGRERSPAAQPPFQR